MRPFRGLLIAGIGVLLTLAVAQTDANAQNVLAVTKITCPTAAGGNVILETAGTLANAVSFSTSKSNLHVRCQGYTGGSVWIQERGTGKTIFRGPVAGLTIVPTVTGDSLKILHLRQYMTNSN